MILERMIIPHSSSTLIIPKLMYGLIELVDLSKSELENNNAQARSCLKSLSNVSKYSKNYISKLYNIPDVSSIIQKRKTDTYQPTFS